HRVTAATRQHAPAALDRLDVSVARGDADVPGQLDAWIEGHDLVVDAAAPSPLHLFISERGAKRDSLAHARRRTQALLDAIARHGAQLAFISSFTTLPRDDNALASFESEWRRRVYPYFRVKQLMEDMVLHAARNGVPAVVLNPSAFLGPWELGAGRSSFVRMVMEQRLPATMRHVINVIDVRDVAALIHAAVAARRYGVPIPLAGHNIAVDELARRIADIAGVQAPLLSTDTRATVVAVFWVENALALARRDAPDAWRAAPLIADAWPMERGAEQRALGVRIRPLDDTLRDAVRWQREHRDR
ncbi:MAG: NAD-dependent epimerase/dehydratase, partial [Gemmatimonadetes bacterium]|nr:NAD-dependent epimerase/dehydratase [Gemmatimonadota bacterium]